MQSYVRGSDSLYTEMRRSGRNIRRVSEFMLDFMCDHRWGIPTAYVSISGEAAEKLVGCHSLYIMLRMMWEILTAYIQVSGGVAEICVGC